MKALKYIIVTIVLIAVIWLYGLAIPRWITNSLLSVVVAVVMYIMYKIDQDKKG